MPAQGARASLTSGLVGYWTFDGKDTNWGTNKTNDLSGQGNTGTLTNMSTTTSPVVGKIGQGLDIYASGGNGRISIGDPVSGILDFAGDYTTSVWVKSRGYINQGSSLNAIFAKKNQDSDIDAGYSLHVNSSNNVNCRMANGATNYITTGNSLADNKWHLITCIRSGSTLTLYRDGISEGTPASPTGSAATSESLFLGFDGSTARNFNGIIDEVRIYNRALSAGEVGQLYKAGQVIRR